MFDNIFPVGFLTNDILVKGDGMYCQGESGRTYLDLNSGQFCAVAGHSSEVLKNALSMALDSIQDTHTSLLSRPAINGLNDLCRISDLQDSKGVLLSTGSEACEFAFRYAKHITNKHGGCSLDIGYHGITYGGAMYSMSREKVRPQPSLSFSVPAPLHINQGSDIESCLQVLRETFEKSGNQIAFFVVEPVISGGGMHWLPAEYLKEAKSLCENFDILFILDECQTGLGRLGRWFSYSNFDFRPDALICGKALGLGFPVSSVIFSGINYDFAQSSLAHFSSHQNEGFAGCLVTSLIQWIEEENILESNQIIGDSFKKKLADCIDPFGGLNLRGEGLMLAFDLNNMNPDRHAIRNGDHFIQICMRHGLLLQHCNFGRTIRILPSYSVQENELDQFCTILFDALKTFSREGGSISHF